MNPVLSGISTNSPTMDITIAYPDFSCELCLEAEAMQSFHNFQGLNQTPSTSRPCWLPYLRVQRWYSRKKKKKKTLPGILLMHTPFSRNTSSTLGDPHLPWTDSSRSNIQERRWLNCDGREFGENQEAATETWYSSSGQWLVQSRKTGMTLGPTTRCPH